MADAVRRGGFAEGAIAHIDWHEIDLTALANGHSAAPLAMIDGTPSVRWSTAGGYRPLADYLDDQIALARARTG